MKVLITGGPVYGQLDDNKLVSNRSRGLWTAKFACFLADCGHKVTYLAPAIQVPAGLVHPNITVSTHTGFDGYSLQCYEYAETHDAAVLGAAVVNWIPLDPYKGKMPTRGFEPGDVIQIPFVLAPRVINYMREINPKLTLIGCKMLSGSTTEELIEAAYKGVIQESKAHVVLANDLSKLRVKHLVYPDKCVQTFDDEWDSLYGALRQLIEDKHWRTEYLSDEWGETPHHQKTFDLFDTIVDKYRGHFLLSSRGQDSVFGSILVRGPGYCLVSPRTKLGAFTSANAVVVQNIAPSERKTLVWPNQDKPTMNAPLLVRMWQQYRPVAILHLHEMLEGVPTVPYAPPGTDRDNMRDLPGTAFNIEGHGFIACLDENLEIVR